MLKNGCEAGCKVFTGGEVYHHKDCQYYPESMSKQFDDLKREVKKLRLHVVNNRFNWNHFFIGYGVGLFLAMIIWLISF